VASGGFPDVQRMCATCAHKKFPEVCGGCYGLSEWKPKSDAKLPDLQFYQEHKEPAPAPAKAGALKFDQDKPRMDLLDAHAIEQLSKVLGFGAKKYAAHNWREGLTKSRLIGAALRHLFAYLRGVDVDEETGLSHAAHAMCCCMFLLGLEHRPELDDRYKENRD